MACAALCVPLSKWAWCWCTSLDFWTPHHDSSAEWRFPLVWLPGHERERAESVSLCFPQHRSSSSARSILCTLNICLIYKNKDVVVTKCCNACAVQFLYFNNSHLTTNSGLVPFINFNSYTCDLLLIPSNNVLLINSRHFKFIEHLCRTREW